MPLNEARGFTRSTLTKEQKRAAEAAIYGLDPHQSYMPQNSSFSFEEIERMRQLVSEHDGSSRGPVREFDLNNPPKEHYTYQELPRVMYHHVKQLTKIARTHAEVAEAEAHGWSKEPFPVKHEEDDDFEEETVLEMAAAEAKLRKKK